MAEIERLRAALRELLVAVKFGPISNLNPDNASANPGYMARIPIGFVDTAEAALRGGGEKQGDYDGDDRGSVRARKSCRLDGMAVRYLLAGGIRPTGTNLAWFASALIEARGPHVFYATPDSKGESGNWARDCDECGMSPDAVPHQ